MKTIKVSVPEDAFSLTEKSSYAIEITTLDKLDDSFWLHGLAVSYAQSNNVVALDNLIQQGLDVSFNNGYLFYVAVQYNNMAMIMFLFDKGLDVNTVSHNETNLLECAASHGHYQMTETLLSFCADPKADCHDPVYSAATLGHTDICKLLLDSGATINMKNLYRNPCVSAIEGDHAVTLDLLLSTLNGSIDINGIASIRINSLSQECAIIMAEHGATLKNISKNEFDKLIKAPTKFISKLTPDMSEELIQRVIDLFAHRSNRNIQDLMIKAPEWLQPYYVSALAKGL